MPVMEGLEASEIIKGSHSYIPIIMQTAYAQPKDKVKALQGGCVDYISTLRYKRINKADSKIYKYLKGFQVSSQ